MEQDSTWFLTIMLKLQRKDDTYTKRFWEDGMAMCTGETGSSTPTLHETQLQTGQQPPQIP